MQAVISLLVEAELPDQFIRPATFSTLEPDPAHRYGKWSLVCEREEGHVYNVKFLADEAPQEALRPGATFLLFDGTRPFAQGRVLH